MTVLKWVISRNLKYESDMIDIWTRTPQITFTFNNKYYCVIPNMSVKDWASSQGFSPLFRRLHGL